MEKVDKNGEKVQKRESYESGLLSAPLPSEQICGAVTVITVWPNESYHCLGKRKGEFMD